MPLNPRVKRRTRTWKHCLAKLIPLIVVGRGDDPSRLFITRGDDDMLFPEDAEVWPFEGKTDEQAQRDIRALVVRHHWWLAGELFDVSGRMGWGPGFYDLEEPDPEKGIKALQKFVTMLVELPFSSAVDDLIGSVMDLQNRSIEARAMRYTLNISGKENMGYAVDYVYDRIADRGSEYMLGAARKYYAYYADNGGEPEVALAGLVLILTRGLNSLKVRAECVKLRRFGALNSSLFYHNVINCTGLGEAINV